MRRSPRTFGGFPITFLRIARARNPICADRDLKSLQSEIRFRRNCGTNYRGESIHFGIQPLDCERSRQSLLEFLAVYVLEFFNFHHARQKQVIVGGWFPDAGALSMI